MKILYIALLTLVTTTANAEWHTEIKEDLMTGEKYGIVATHSTIDDDDYLAVQCRREILVGVTYKWANLSENRISFLYRFDKETAVKKNGSSTASEDTILIDGVDSFISKLLKHLKVAFRVEDFKGEEHDSLFALIGFRRAFAKACSWHIDYDYHLDYDS